MSDLIRVDVEVLDQHAVRVGLIAGDVGVARDAGGSVDLAGGAFGVLCSFLVVPASLVQTAACAAIGSVADLLDRTQSTLTSIAAGWGETEQVAKQEIDRLNSQVGVVP